MRRIGIVASLLLGATITGCGGSNEIQLPTDKLTAEQLAQIKKDDAKVADEESHAAKKR